MRPITFQSGLAHVLERFVRLRQSTGRDYRDQAYLLQRFDRFLVEQVRALLQAARGPGLADPLRPHTVETFLGLLYTTGMRTGEALVLNLEDVHSDREALYIRQGGR